MTKSKKRNLEYDVLLVGNGLFNVAHTTKAPNKKEAIKKATRASRSVARNNPGWKLKRVEIVGKGRAK